MINIFKSKTALLMIAEAIVLGGVIFGVSNKSHKNKNNFETAQHNIEVLIDSLEVQKLANGELMADKQALILEKSDLEQFLDISKSKVKELEKKNNSNIAMISQLKAQVETGPIYVTKDSLIYIKDSVSRYMFEYNDDWVKFNGITDMDHNVFKTTMNNISINTPMTVGITDDYNIFVTTPNPYITFTDIQGAVIEKSRFVPKPKRFNVGFQIGFGGQWGLLNNKFDIGPYAGVGISYGFGF